MKVIICGDRNWSDIHMILEYISSLPKDTLIIQGECRGADHLAKSAAKFLGYPTTEHYYAKWEIHGLKAGPIRNREMLKEKPDLVVAFHDSLLTSKGTKDMLNAAKEAGVKTLVLSHNSSIGS